MNLLKPIRYSAAYSLSFLRSRKIVWNFLNRSSMSLYDDNLPNLDMLQKSVSDELLNNGISSINLDEIFPKKNMLETLLNSIDYGNFFGKTQPRKPFLTHYWAEPTSEQPEIDLGNPFIQFILNPRVLNIINSYMKSYAKLAYFDLAKTSPMGPEKNPIASQRWHRDPGLKKIVKVFIYLNDVDQDSGPFQYVSCSHQIGRLNNLSPQKQFGRHGSYAPDGYVENNVNENEIKCCTGRAGTVIFCDTTGIHKGGHAKKNQRIMFTAMFVSEGDFIKPMFTLPNAFDESSKKLDPISKFSLTRN